MDDLTAVKKQKAWLYIMDTLTNISIISSQSDLGMDFYLQAACTFSPDNWKLVTHKIASFQRKHIFMNSLHM